jgi:hypothetical protein
MAEKQKPKVKATGSSEVTVPNYQNAQHHMTEDGTKLPKCTAP